MSTAPTEAPEAGRGNIAGVGLAALALWVAVYSQLAAFAHWAAFDGLGLAAGSRLASASEFFTPDRTRALLAGRREAVGTVLAFMMSVIALSAPEAVILRKVLSKKLIGVFFGVVALGILMVGYLFNSIF